MLLSIFNLPLDITYPEVKELIRSTCGLKEVILDNLVRDGQAMNVTVGVMEEEDAAIIIRKISGLFFQGKKLFVQDKRQKKDSGPQQPYDAYSQSQYDQANQYYYNAAAQYQMAYGMPNMFGQMANIAMMYPPQGAAQTPQNPYSYGQQGQIGAPQTPALVPQPYSNVGPESYNQQYNEQTQSWSADNNFSSLQERSSNREKEPSRDRDSNREPYKAGYKDSRSSRDDRDPSRGSDRHDRHRSPRQQSGSSRRDESNRGRPTFDQKPSFGRDDTRNDSNNSFGGPSFDQRPPRDINNRNDPNKPFVRPSFDGKSSGTENNTRNESFVRAPFKQQQLGRMENNGNKSFVRQPFNQQQSGRMENSRNESFVRPPFNQSQTGRMDNSRNDPNKPVVRPSFDPQSGSSKTNWNRPNEPFVRPSFDRGPSTSAYGARNDSNKPFIRPTAPQNVKKKRKLDNPNTTFNQNKKSRFGPPVQNSPSLPGSQEPLDMQRVRMLHRNAPEQFIQQQYDRRQTNRCLMQGAGMVATTIKKNVELRVKYIRMGEEFVKNLKLMVGQAVRDRVYDIIGGDYSLKPFEVMKLYREKYNEDDDVPFVESLSRDLINAINEGRPISIIGEDIDSMSHLTKRKRSQLRKREQDLNKSVKKLSKKINFKPGQDGQPLIPAHPMGDHKIAKFNKKKTIQELETLEPARTSPSVAKALDEEVELISKFFHSEFQKPNNIRAAAVYKVVDQDACVTHLNKYLKFMISRRMADKGVKMLRIYGRPHLPKRTDLEQFLIKYDCISLKKNHSNVFFIASFKSYKVTDKLVNMGTVTMGDKSISVDFKYLLDAPKPPKLKYKDIKKVRENRIQSHIDVSKVNLLDKDWQEQQAAEDELRKKALEPPPRKNAVSQDQNADNSNENEEKDATAENVDFTEDVLIESTENDSESKLTTKPDDVDTENVEQNLENEPVSDYKIENVEVDKQDTEEIKTDVSNTEEKADDVEKSDQTEENDMFAEKVLKNFHVIDEIKNNDSADKDAGGENEEWEETGDDWGIDGENDDREMQPVSLADINDAELNEDDFVDY